MYVSMDGSGLHRCRWRRSDRIQSVDSGGFPRVVEFIIASHNKSPHLWDRHISDQCDMRATILSQLLWRLPAGFLQVPSPLPLFFFVLVVFIHTCAYNIDGYIYIYSTSRRDHSTTTPLEHFDTSRGLKPLTKPMWIVFLRCSLDPDPPARSAASGSEIELGVFAGGTTSNDQVSLRLPQPKGNFSFNWTSPQMLNPHTGTFTVENRVLRTDPVEW